MTSEKFASRFGFRHHFSSMLKKSYRWWVASNPILQLSHPSRDSLRRAFQQGDELAFSKVYSRYRGPITAYVLQRVRDREVAAELVQEVFLKAHRFRGTFDPSRTLTTWLWTIARNTVTDSFRRKELDTSFNRGEFEPEQLQSQEPDVETQLEQMIEQIGDRRFLKRMMGKMTELQRNVMMMSLVQNLSYGEIAQKLEISVSAVKCVAYRSRKFLVEAASAHHWAGMGDNAGVLFPS
jgi:RNA polymerase sigma-70 factor, ECF subfamily